MNRTDFTKVGGFPELLDHYEFEQSPVRQALTAIMDMFEIQPDPLVDTPHSFIIRGCTQYTSVYLGGYIYFKGEIYIFDTTTTPTPSGGQSLVWAVAETYDATGDKTMEDTSTAHAYVVRKMVLIAAIYDASIHLLVAGAARFEDKIVSLFPQDTDWIISGTKQYRKTKSGFIQLAGILNDAIFTLPVGYRPATDYTVAVIQSNVAMNEIAVYVLTI